MSPGEEAEPASSEPRAKARPARRTGSRPLRVAIANDYELIVRGVGAMLKPFADRVAVVEFDVEADSGRAVDVALFDTYGQASLGIPRIRALADRGTVGTVVVYTWSITDAGRAAVRRAGAGGLVAKALPAHRLTDALETAASGRWIETGHFRSPGPGTWPGDEWSLSARESETLALLATGMTNRSIAEALFVSENTIRTHLKAVFRKLGVTTRSQAVARALTDASFQTRRQRPPPAEESQDRGRA